jgi:hypothetical protein
MKLRQFVADYIAEQIEASADERRKRRSSALTCALRDYFTSTIGAGA